MVWNVKLPIMLTNQGNQNQLNICYFFQAPQVPSLKLFYKKMDKFNDSDNWNILNHN